MGHKESIRVEVRCSPPRFGGEHLKLLKERWIEVLT